MSTMDNLTGTEPLLGEDIVFPDQEVSNYSMANNETKPDQDVSETTADDDKAFADAVSSEEIKPDGVSKGNMANNETNPDPVSSDAVLKEEDKVMPDEVASESLVKQGDATEDSSKSTPTDIDDKKDEVEVKSEDLMDEDAVTTEDEKKCAKKEKLVEEEDATDKKKNNGKKKRKKEAATAPSGEPKAKKPRVKPETLQKVYDLMKDELIKCCEMGLTEKNWAELTLSLGYKNPRSDAPIEAMKKLKEDGVAIKTKDTLKMTEEFIKKHTPEEVVPANPEEVFEQKWAIFEKKLSSNSKSSGDKVMRAAEAVWEKLKDGSAIKSKELVTFTEYKGTNSTGYEQILKALKELKFMKSDGGQLSFTDTMFPFGRP